MQGGRTLRRAAGWVGRAVVFGATLVVGFLWLRSYLRYDVVIVEGELAYVHSVAGSIIFDIDTRGDPPRRTWGIYWESARRGSWSHGSESAWDETYGEGLRWVFEPRSVVEWLGFRWRDPVKGSPLTNSWQRGIPYWILEAPLVLASAWVGRPLWREWRRRKRTKMGLCDECGYDLRAHKAGEKCPECGSTVR